MRVALRSVLARTASLRPATPASRATSTRRAAAADPFAENRAPIVLYDGVCRMCNFWVDWVLDNDPTAKLRFAALQSPAAGAGGGAASSGAAASGPAAARYLDSLNALPTPLEQQLADLGSELGVDDLPSDLCAELNTADLIVPSSPLRSGLLPGAVLPSMSDNSRGVDNNKKRSFSCSRGRARPTQGWLSGCH